MQTSKSSPDTACQSVRANSWHHSSAAPSPIVVSASVADCNICRVAALPCSCQSGFPRFFAPFCPALFVRLFLFE